jgi:hypothetical protein
MTQFEASQEQVTSDNVGAGVHAPVLAPLAAAGVNTGKRMAITTIGALISTLSAVVIAQSTRPEIFQISPTSGPEGSRVEITGKNFREPRLSCWVQAAPLSVSFPPKHSSH